MYEAASWNLAAFLRNIHPYKDKMGTLYTVIPFLFGDALSESKMPQQGVLFTSVPALASCYHLAPINYIFIPWVSIFSDWSLDGERGRRSVDGGSLICHVRQLHSVPGHTQLRRRPQNAVQSSKHSFRQRHQIRNTQTSEHMLVSGEYIMSIMLLPYL